MDAVKEMSIGNVVDYVIEYNEIHKAGDEGTPQQTRRKATQADWDAFWG